MGNFARKLRFSWIGKFIFGHKWTDCIFRRLFVRRYDNKHYGDSSKNAIKINNELNPILKKYNGFLGHGLALSIIRDNKTPTYQDLDYDIYAWDKIDEIIDDMQKLGYEVYTIGYLNGEVKLLTFAKDDSYIDFFICKKIDNSFDVCTVCCETNRPKFKQEENKYISDRFICYVRKMSYTEIESKKIDDNLFYLPKDYDTYFSEMYGKDWRTPKKYFNWALNPKNNMPIKVKNNVKAILSSNNYMENYK